MLSMIVLAVVVILSVLTAVMRASMSLIAHPIAFTPKAIRWFARLIGGIFVLGFVITLLTTSHMSIWEGIQILIPVFAAFTVSWLMDRWLEKMEPAPVIEVHHYYENEPSVEQPDIIGVTASTVRDETIK